MSDTSKTADAIREEMRTFAEDVLRPAAAEIDRTEEYPFDHARKLAEMGINGMTMPEEYGGRGASFADVCIAVEEAARVCGISGRIVVDTNMGAVPAIMNYGTEAMALGTSGLTAALAVQRIEGAGLTPADGPIAVSGATGGVGSTAIDIFAKRGFDVTAVSGKTDHFDFLRALGATKVMTREELFKDKRPLVPEMLWAGAFDNVGGEYLDRLLARTMPHGKVASAGMAVGTELSTSVLPFVLRSVDLLGINVSRQLQMPERLALWNRLATDLKPRHFDKFARPIPFEELDDAMDRFFNVTTVGRVVVEVGEKAPV